MKKGQRFILWLFISFSFISFAMFKALAMVEDGRTKPLEYPESTLSQDLFVSQNTDYVVNEQLQDSYSYKTVPYMVDLVKGDVAEIEEGHLVRVTDTVTLFLTEYPKDKDFNEVILNQYPPAVYLNYSKDNSYAQTVKDSLGYINGYNAKYFINHLLISIGPSVTAQSIYMIGYDVNLGSDYENNVLLSIATTDATTENLALCKKYLDAFIYTLRFDSKLDTDLKRKAAEEAREAEKEAKLEEKELEDTSYNPGSLEFKYPVNASRDFKNLSVVVSWDKPTSGMVTMDIQNQSGITITKSSNVTSTQALFECGQCASGTYYIYCPQLSDLGSVKVKLIENGGN